MDESASSLDKELIELLNVDLKFEKATTLDELWVLFLEFTQTLRADLVSYHHFGHEFAPHYKNETVHVEGFPEFWTQHYINDNLVDFDPIILTSRLRIRPFWWLDIYKLTALTPRQKEYMEELTAWMKGDGLAIPVFGPSARHGYFGVGCQNTPRHWDKTHQKRLHFICESFHLRYCEIRLTTMKNDFTLTKKERFILENMAFGRSDSMICGLTGLQLHAVQGAIHRILKKMQVTDRPSAILRGVGCGLIEADIIT